MVKWQNFIEVIKKSFGEYRTKDQDQKPAIMLGKKKPIYTDLCKNNTAILTLRILKLVLLNDVLPQHIIAPTLTRKNAKELRSRLTDWFEAITLNLQLQDFLDWNPMLIETLDPISDWQIGRGEPKPGILLRYDELRDVQYKVN